MTAMCPSCGVAIIPGYVRCPKCRAALPVRAKRPTADPGGTVLAERRFPVVPVIAVVAVAGLVVLFATRGGGRASRGQPIAAPASVAEVVAEPSPSRIAPAAPAPEAAPTHAPDPAAAVGGLERALKRQKLWASVEIRGGRIDVRSAFCGDPQMAPVIESARASLREAGLTRLRCLEQSGAVVVERDL
ncbi:MAG: hypothetical protein ACTHU0_09165 [Kofleriaceae bacterium]